MSIKVLSIVANSAKGAVLTTAKEIVKEPKKIDLFNIIFDSLSPYAFSILKLALAATLYSNSIRIIRIKKGGAVSGGGNPYSGITTAFFGYLAGRGTPIIIKVTDQICDQVLDTMGGK